MSEIKRRTEPININLIVELRVSAAPASSHQLVPYFRELRFLEFEPHWKIDNEEALIIQLSMFIENTVIIGTGMTV